MKILLLSRYTDAGPSSRYRSFQYLPYLRTLGHEITVAPLLGDLYLKRRSASSPIPVFNVMRSYLNRVAILLRARQFDLIWIEYEAFPWIPYWFESLLLSSGIPYMVDYDDAVFHRYDQHSSPIIRGILGKKIDRVMKGADLVLAGNEYLADRARQSGSRWIEILPTVIDLCRYPLTPQSPNERFTIGWIGSFSTGRYLMEIEEALKNVSTSGRARIVIIGATPPNQDVIKYDIKQWRSEELEIEECLKFDVGIMPLPDAPWERGKGGHKLIKYMAASRPVIASPVGINRSIVDHGVNGFLASTALEWITSLNILRDDEKLRALMGLAGRRKVETKYCIQVTGPILADLMTEVVRESHGRNNEPQGLPRLEADR